MGLANRKRGEAKDRKKKAESREKGGSLFFFLLVSFEVGFRWDKKKRAKEGLFFREVIKKERRKLVAFDWIFIIFGI